MIKKRHLEKRFNLSKESINLLCRKHKIKTPKLTKDEAQDLINSMYRTKNYKGKNHIKIIEMHLKSWSNSLICKEVKMSHSNVVRAIDSFYINDRQIIVESKLNFMI